MVLKLIMSYYILDKSGRVRAQFNEQLPLQEECSILSIWDAKDGTLFLRWRLPIELCSDTARFA